MRIPTKLMLGVLLGGLLFPSILWAEQYYKWVDDQGVTHYSEEKPENQDTSKVKAHNPPSSSQDQAMERLRQERKEQEQERQAAQEDKENGKDSQAINQERCEKHRKNLETLNTTAQVRRKNPETGEMETLTQEERQAMIEKTKKALERCNENNSN